jgi:arginase
MKQRDEALLGLLPRLRFKGGQIRLGEKTIMRDYLQFSVIDAASILGLKPMGVETLPEALKQAGLVRDLPAEYAGRVDAPPYDSERDPATLVLNLHSIREFSLRLAEKVAEVRGQGRFPVVLGGDCSILIGCMLALRLWPRGRRWGSR